MDTQPRIEQFLTLEVTMQLLMDQLNQLREETESYSNAGQSLASASEHIDSLSKQLGTVAGEIQKTAVSLREIGTPELLARQQGLQEQLNQLLAELENQKVENEAARRDSEHRHSTTVNAISGVGELVTKSNQVLSEMAETVTTSIETFRSETAAGNDALIREIQTLTDTTGRLQDRVNATELALGKQIRTLQILMLVLTILAVAVVSGLIILL